MAGRVSVVIPAHNEGENLVDTVRCVLDDRSFPDLEVVVVDDGSTDGSGDRVRCLFSTTGQVTVVQGANLGVANARNLGSRYAGGDILVFLDAHCYPSRGWLIELVALLDTPGTAMVGPSFGDLAHGDGARGLGMTWADASLRASWLPAQGVAPYPVPLLPGGCHALRRVDFEQLGGYDEGMSRWGSEDLELSLRTWLFGYELWVQPSVVVYHLFRERHPYTVDVDGVLYNLFRLATLHFRAPRVTAVLDAYKAAPGFTRSILQLVASDVMARRRALEARRVRDDDWFMERFGCCF